MRVFILALAFTSFPVAADWTEIAERRLDESTPAFHTGNTLLTLQTNDRLIFIGFVIGVHDAAKRHAKFCSPDGATSGQLADVVTKYLRENPARRAEQAHWLVQDAFTAAWPCQK